MNKSVQMLGVVIGLVVLAQGGCTVANMEHQRSTIPAKLATGMFYAEGNCGDWLSYQGAQVFSLRKQTTEALKSQGLRFFADIDSSKNRAALPYYNGTWRTTPVPNADMPDGRLGNMRCAMDHSWRWPAGILAALKRPGGFYQTAGGRTLIVLPEQGYVVAVASDR